MKSKKIVSFMLALALCVPVITADIVNNENLTISTYADATTDGFEYVINTTQGYVAITGYSGSATDIVIPSEIEGYPVTIIGNKAFNAMNVSNNFQQLLKVTSISIPNTITTIDEYAFYDCTSLININIPDSVTYIGNNAFSYCKSLTNIIIPNSVTYIGKYAFQGCSSLFNINIPDSVTIIDNGTFYGCTSLTSITIPNSIISINDYAFKNCTSLKEIIIPSNVTNIGNTAFKNCTNLETVTIKSPNTKINNTAFDSCYVVNIVYDYEEETTTTTTEPLITEPSTTTTNELIRENNFKNGIYGDMNGDGVANIIDLLLMKKLILNIKVPTPLVTTTTKSLDDTPPT